MNGDNSKESWQSSAKQENKFFNSSRWFMLDVSLPTANCQLPFLESIEL